MYTFKITGKSGIPKNYEHIVKVCYTMPTACLSDMKETVVEGDEILTHRYKTNCDLYLYAADACYVISKRDLVIIEATKEKQFDSPVLIILSIKQENGRVIQQKTPQLWGVFNNIQFVMKIF